MAMEQAPNPRETQEFQFKLLARLRLFKENPQLPLKQSISLVASASKFGLIFVGSSTGFDVIQTARIIEQCAGVKKPSSEVAEFPRRPVSLGSQPTHLDVSCDGQHLAVACAGFIRIYDVTSFTAQSEKVVQDVRVLAAVQTLSWNPGIPNMLAAVMADGSAAVYEFKNNTFEINSIPPEAHATCLCWSPKGKQIVIGSRNGSLNQFKPELKIVKAIPPPQGDWTLVSVHWLSNFQYAAVYSPQGQHRPNLIVVNTPKNPPAITYVNYDDITYSNGDNRTNQFYFIHQQAWNVLLVASANSMEVGVLGRAGEGPWQQWQMEDAARAELPLSAAHTETHPVGMALDISPQYNLPWGENQQLPPMPLLLLLSHEGLLTLYWCVNLLPGSASVCVPPTPLPDTSGLHLFTSGTTVSSPAQQQAQQSPQKPQTTLNTPAPAFAATTPTAAFAVSSAAPAFAVSSAAPAFAVSTAPPSFSLLAPVAASTPASTPAFAPTGQWQPPPATSQPAWTVPALSAAQSDKPLGSWMNSSAASVPAFSAAVVSSASQPTFPAQPISFGSSETFGKPAGAFVQPSMPTVPKATPVVTSAAPTPAPATIEIPAASFPVKPPSTVSTPEPEVTEESEQLREMNEALIQDSIREEINFCNKELQQLGHRVRGLKVNVLDEGAVEKLTADIENMSAFMKELKETTDVQTAEVETLRNFILQSFSYVESMKTRLRLQNNPDYMSIQSSQGLDPIQARRMADIRSNVQFIEGQLKKLSQEIVERWGIFQDYNKENREVLHIPSMEAIFQVMVMQNSVVTRQRARVAQLEKRVAQRDRKQVLGLLSASRMVDDFEAEHKKTDVSKIADDFLSLNLKKFTKETSVDELQESVSVFSLSSISNSPREMNYEQPVMLQQLFNDSQIKHLNSKKIWTSPLRATRNQSPRSEFGSPSTIVGSDSHRTLSTSKYAESSNIVKNSKAVEDLKAKSPITKTTTTSINGSYSALGNQMRQTVSSSSLQVSPQSKLTQSSSSTSEAPKSWVCSSCKSPDSSSMNKVDATQPVSAPLVFTPQTTASTKVFSFAPVVAPLISVPFSTQSPTIGSNTTSQSESQPFVTLSKTFTYTTTTAMTTVAPSLFTSSFKKAETPKSVSSSLASTPPKNASDNSFNFSVSASPVVANINPLASLSSLVAGIEPLKSPIKPQATVEQSKPTATQSFMFKATGEDKTISTKDTGASPQKNTGFSFTMESKPEIKNGSASPGDNKNQFSGAFKKLSFESGPVKTIFGGTPTSASTTTEAEKSAQTTKNVFSFSNPTSSSLFSSSSAGTMSPKTIFGAPATTVSSSVASSLPVMQVKPVDSSKTEDSEPDTPVIEVCLSPPKSGGDTKSSLEKLASSKGITITKVDIPEKKTDTEVIQEADLPASSFGLSSFTTPTKSSSNIFGGSSPTKPSLMYEISKPEQQSSPEKKPEKTGEDKKETNTSKPQSIFGGLAANTSTSATSFSFSSSTLQSSENTQPSTGFTFGLKTPESTSLPSTTSAVTSAQATSTFSFAQATTTSAQASPAFSFNLSSTSSTTSTSSTFGLGSLSTALSSDDNTKSAFSFGQPAKTPSSTSASIFGGFGVKTTESTVFGQASAATTSASDQNKTIFGTPTTTTETKSLFGTPSTTSETKSIFGASTTSSETKSMFGTPTTGSETKSLFGTSTTSSETKSIFGASTTSSETKGIFGVPTTTSETKSIFGTSTTTSETKSIFGAPSTTSETKSIFGTPSTSSETKSIFVAPATSAFGTAATSTESKSIFGQSTNENKSIFGQSSAPSGESKPEFSFSLSNTSSGAQTSFFGTPTTNTTSFFGQQICSPTSTASSPFGQPTTTPSVFGSPAPSPFGSTPTFGQSGGSLFGGQSAGSSGGFGTSGGSMFGGGFGSSQPSSPFGSTSGGSGSMFGGSFSSGGQSVGQTGFGTPAFQSKPAAFGSTSPQPAFGAPPAFGAAPTFGGSPAFGSPPKLFGSPTAPSAGFGSTQQSSTFENLANQNTMTFGNLAQSQTPAFGSGGSVFGGAQQQTTPAFAPATTTSMSFGGSSFTSWR